VDLGKNERNDLLRAILDGKLSDKCSLNIRQKRIIITHLRSKSYCIIRPTLNSYNTRKIDNAADADWFDLHTKVWDDPPRVHTESDWLSTRRQVSSWASKVADWENIPDYWTLTERGWRTIAGPGYDRAGNTFFIPAEQAAISAYLMLIKEQVKQTYQLTGGQIARLDARFDEAEKASRRMGRKDWLVLFLGTVSSLVLSDTITPNILHHILVLGAHYFAHILNGPGGPQLSPPP
jgi:hypothetical protein